MSLNPTFFDKKFYVIAYDIVEDRRRTRVMKLLKGYGFHAQKSVFECYLSAEQLRRLTQRLQKEINEEVDNIRIYSLTLEQMQQVRIIGRGELPQLGGITVV